MKETTAADESLSQFAKSLVVAASKEGKTVGLVAGALGVLPWQRFGGVVDKPDNLHVIALDSGAATGIKPFLELCKAPKEAFSVRIYNMADDVRSVSTRDEDWDFTFFHAFKQVAKRVQERAQKGTSLVLVSSLTTLALTLQRSLAGAPGDDAARGSGMDQAKWGELGRQVNELRNMLQQDYWHCVWEGHVYKPPATGQGRDADSSKESIQVQGSSGHNFPNNVEQVFRFRRDFGNTHEGTRVERVALDTRPSMDFLAGGRGFTEYLDAKEADMTVAFRKIGLKCGRWGYVKKKEKK